MITTSLIFRIGGLELPSPPALNDEWFIHRDRSFSNQLLRSTKYGQFKKQKVLSITLTLLISA